MDDSTATTPSPSSAAATAAGYDAARDKTNEAAAAAAAVTASNGSGNSGIRLLIKSSNQQYDDMNIESDLCWTVKRLKKQLSLVYPGKPEINDQKLIYSGKLLDDAQKLSEVIRSYKDVYQQHHIFHLVCANKNKAPYKAPARPKDTTSAPRVATNTNENELRQRNVTPTAASVQNSYVQPSELQQANPQLWLQLQHQLYQLPAGQNVSTESSVPGSATNPHLAFRQHQAFLYNAWMQQWYAVYMQQMQRTSGSGNVMTPPMLPPFAQNMPNVGVPLVGHQTVAAGAAAAQPNEEAVARQPAARPVDGPNFPNIQEEPEMRDWLDSFFNFTRLAIFVTVLYFNSSPMRCLLVVLIASVIYLYHIGILRRRRERNNNNINRNNNAGNNGAGGFGMVQQIQRMMDAAVLQDNEPQAAAQVADANEPAAAAAPGPDAGQNGDAAQPAASAGGDQPDAASAAAEAVAVEPANANNSVISIMRTFVITFFTSLLPEAPAL